MPAYDKIDAATIQRATKENQFTTFYDITLRIRERISTEVSYYIEFEIKKFRRTFITTISLDEDRPNGVNRETYNLIYLSFMELLIFELLKYFHFFLIFIKQRQIVSRVDI